MAPDEAEREAKSGRLVGKGCEVHEEKVRARIERLETKRKNQKAARDSRKKKRKLGNGNGGGNGNGDADGNGHPEEGETGWNAGLHGEEENEEERLLAGL